MTWVRPDEAKDPGGRWATWIYAAVGYLALSAGTLTAVLTDPGPFLPWTLALVMLAAVWLALLVPLYPRRTRHPAGAAVFYIGLLAVTVALLRHSNAFAWFSWIGFPYGFALFPARWSVCAVAANALVTVAAQTDMFTRPEPVGGTVTYVVLFGVVTPVIFAGWVAGAESEKRRQANAELAETNVRLANALEENAGLQAQLLVQAREAGVADERARLAREIHDTLAQGLTGIVTHLQAAQRQRADPEVWPRHVERARALAAESLTEARRSVRALRPEQLERSHLPEAIDELACRWRENSAVPVDLAVTGEPRPLPAEVEVALFRVAQEALHNVAKHAEPSRVGVTLSYLDDVVLLDVRDDGRGFDPNGAAPDGFGLDTMRQRVIGVGGSFEVESAPGEGTAISAQIPATPAEEREETP